LAAALALAAGLAEAAAGAELVVAGLLGAVAAPPQALNARTTQAASAEAFGNNMAALYAALAGA